MFLCVRTHKQISIINQLFVFNGPAARRGRLLAAGLRAAHWIWTSAAPKLQNENARLETEPERADLTVYVFKNWHSENYVKIDIPTYLWLGDENLR